MVCPNCGAQIPQGTSFCQLCGTSVQNAQPQYQSQYQYPTYPNQYGAPPVKDPEVPGKGQGVASMILGIISLVSFCSFSVPIICAIISIVLGCVSKSKAKAAGMKNGMATAGIVMSVICLSLWVFIIIAYEQIKDIPIFTEIFIGLEELYGYY